MAAYSEFEAEFLGPITTVMLHDGVSCRILDELSREDRVRAVQALQKRLEEHDRPGSRGPDYRAVVGLGHLAALGEPMPEGTVPLLRAALPRTRGELRAEVAFAIWELTKDETMLDVVLALTRTSALGARLAAMFDRYATDYDLVQAIHVLARFPQRAARRRLEELTLDPRSGIRYNAEFALGRGRLHGIPDGS